VEPDAADMAERHGGCLRDRMKPPADHRPAVPAGKPRRRAKAAQGTGIGARVVSAIQDVTAAARDLADGVGFASPVPGSAIRLRTVRGSPGSAAGAGSAPPVV
jgi:hypothetical protein